MKTFAEIAVAYMIILTPVVLYAFGRAMFGKGGLLDNFRKS